MKLASFIVLLSFAISSVAPSWAAMKCFGDPLVFPADHNLKKVIAGDLNEDGNADLIISSDTACSSGAVTAYLGKGDGRFVPELLSMVRGTPRDLALADLNADGHLDLILTSPCGGQLGVEVLLGNGDGSFQSFMSYPVGPDPLDLAVGDFNNDSKLDVLVSNYHGKDQYLSLGNGDGTLQSAIKIPAIIGLSGTGSIQAADLNNDGNLDFAVAAVATDSSIKVLTELGNGDGTFGHSHLLPGLSLVSSLAIGDLNLDGNLDLVQVGRDKLGIWLGAGDGTFHHQVSYAAPDELSLMIGNLGNDGVPDLVLADEVMPANVEVLKGKGDGTFPVQSMVPSGNSTSSIALADFNADGLLDIAGIHGLIYQGYGTVLLNTGQCR